MQLGTNETDRKKDRKHRKTNSWSLIKDRSKSQRDRQLGTKEPGKRLIETAERHTAGRNESNKSQKDRQLGRNETD